MDYRRDDKGACASCKHCRSFIKGKTIHDGEKLIPYDGSKDARCEKNPGMHIIMLDQPRLDLPVNDCWESTN